MFTGIVEIMGEVSDVAEIDGGRRLEISSPGIVSDLGVGDSVSVSGACLTAIEVTSSGFAAEVVSETLSRTSLGGLRRGDRVNLERAMRSDGRFDGHIVQGHIDGVGVVASVQAEGTGRRISIECSSDLLRYIVEKGSITVDGVSFTVAARRDDGFEIAVIPHTIEATTAGQLEPAATVNLEVDILAKYVERLMEAKA